jgi:hypothetical protein
MRHVEEVRETQLDVGVVCQERMPAPRALPPDDEPDAADATVQTRDARQGVGGAADLEHLADAIGVRRGRGYGEEVLRGHAAQVADQPVE